MSFKKPQGFTPEKFVPNEEEKSKINEVRKLIGPAANKFPCQFSDASVLRFLRARNSNTRRAAKMMKETLKWRQKYKPEMTRWDDIAHEAKTGKLYRANYSDKCGRTVLVMRPNGQLCGDQIKCLVYCLESAISNLHEGQEQMVWLIDFRRWNMSSISVKMVKPFLEPKTYKRVKFVYWDEPQTVKVMEALFDMDKLESAFGGKNMDNLEFEAYGKRIKDEEAPNCEETRNTIQLQDSDFLISDVSSELSEEADSSSNCDHGYDKTNDAAEVK